MDLRAAVRPGGALVALTFRRRPRVARYGCAIDGADMRVRRVHKLRSRKFLGWCICSSWFHAMVIELTGLKALGVFSEAAYTLEKLRQRGITAKPMPASLTKQHTSGAWDKGQ